MISSPTFFNNRIQCLFISSKCVSGANETNCALNVMSPTGLRNSPSPGLAGPFARSECLPSAGKAGCSLADSPGKSPSGLPGSRPHWNLPGESAYPLRGKLRPARPEKSSRSSRPHGSLRAESKLLWYTLTLFNWNGCAVMQLWWNKIQILYNWKML